MSDAPPDQSATSDTGGGERSRVFAFAPGDAFLVRLATAILDGEFAGMAGTSPAPIGLASTTILLPTRRAARNLADAFLEVSGANAVLLPNILPITQTESDAALLANLGTSGATAAALDVPPAIPELESRLVLTRLILEWGHAVAQASGTEGDFAAVQSVGARTPAQAAHLANELFRLTHMLETFGVEIDTLGDCVPDAFSRHWQLTLDFLKIATTFWPAHLDERGMISPAGRRIADLNALSAQFKSGLSAGPVVAAGITGLEPATLKLLSAITSLPNGAVVLPGLDANLDESSWQAIAPGSEDVVGDPEHAQYELRMLLRCLGVERSKVNVLPARTKHAAVMADRNSLVSEAMRPAGTTEQWHKWTQSADKQKIESATRNIHLIEATGTAEEAEVIALILRRCAEDESVTAALVTPDRLLARRVAVRLQAWGIRVDDSAGRPFAKTVPGTFLELIIECAAKNFAPAPLMSLLKHPLCRLARDPFDIRSAARALEISTFRRIYLGSGLEGVEVGLANASAGTRDLTHTHTAARRLRKEYLSNAALVVEDLKTAFAPLVEIFSNREPHDLASFAAAHLAVAEALAKHSEEESAATNHATAEPVASPLYSGEAGEAVASFFSGLLDQSALAPNISPPDYPDFYRALTAGQNVRPNVPLHPRLFIWGPLEARLQQTDIVILGALNDGTWPQAADPGPWLNRPMRAELGLPSPEQALGNVAHDFHSLLNAETVYLTRARKVDGVPTVRSRWLMRLAALLDGIGMHDALGADAPWLSWARASTAAATGKRQLIAQPQPRPPVALRPRRLSVSDVETWIANPYALYAKKILNLAPLPALGVAPDASLKGSIVHAALAHFTAQTAKDWPDAPYDAFMQIARETIADYAGSPRVAAFWLPRIARFARWFVETEPDRRKKAASIAAEVSGSMSLSAPAGEFTLTARADRIDIMSDGIIITDYKTGQAPSDKRVNLGFAPQLPLEAAIAEQAGFDGVPAHAAHALRYIRATGGEPAGISRDVKTDKPSSQLGSDAVEALARLIAQFDDETTPYAALARSDFASRPDDYAHLARFAEWALGPGGED